MSYSGRKNTSDIGLKSFEEWKVYSLRDCPGINIDDGDMMLFMMMMIMILKNDDGDVDNDDDNHGNNYLICSD